MKRTIVLVVALVLLLVACQPTPEKEIVVQRDNTEKVVVQSEKEEVEETKVFKYETPSHIEERFTILDDLDMVIDADVTMPDIDCVPVAKVRTNLFTQERADQLREFFMQDGKLVSQYVPTKADYDEMIIDAKRGHEVDGEMVFDESSKQWVEQLIKEREKAPDKDVKNLITDYSIEGEDGLSGRIVLNGKDAGSIYIRQNSFGYYSEKHYRLSKIKQYTETGEPIELPTCEIKMTEEEAIAVAQEHLKAMDIEGLAVIEMDKAYFVSGYGKDAEVYFGGYHIEFMREFGGMMPINIKGYGMHPDDKFDVSPPVDVELLTMTIDERGNIYNFTWKNPIEIVDVLTEHVEILSFEDIMNRLREFSKIQWAYMGGYTSTVKSIKKIFDIRFSLSYLPLKNNPNEFMYAPCWAFAYKDLTEYTEEQLEYLEEHGMSPIHEDEMATEYIIFSAVDGASVSVYSSKAFEERQRWKAERDND